MQWIRNGFYLLETQSLFVLRMQVTSLPRPHPTVLFCRGMDWVISNHCEWLHCPALVGHWLFLQGIIVLVGWVFFHLWMSLLARSCRLHPRAWRWDFIPFWYLWLPLAQDVSVEEQLSRYSGWGITYTRKSFSHFWLATENITYSMDRAFACTTTKVQSIWFLPIWMWDWETVHLVLWMSTREPKDLKIVNSVLEKVGKAATSSSILDWPRIPEMQLYDVIFSLLSYFCTLICNRSLQMR